MLAISASGFGVDASSVRLIDSVSAMDRKPIPMLLLPVDGHVATAMQTDVEKTSVVALPERRRGTDRQSTSDDATYRYKRQRNNEAARRSRQKRRQQDGVIRRQLEALAAENRELRSQLALLRRLLDDMATTTSLRRGGRDGALQRGFSLPSIVSSAGDQSRPEFRDDESSIGDVTTASRESKSLDGYSSESSISNEPVELTDAIKCVDWQHQLLTPLNLSQRHASA